MQNIKHFKASKRLPQNMAVTQVFEYDCSLWGSPKHLYTFCWI